MRKPVVYVTPYEHVFADQKTGIKLQFKLSAVPSHGCKNRHSNRLKGVGSIYQVVHVVVTNGGKTSEVRFTEMWRVYQELRKKWYMRGKKIQEREECVFVINEDGWDEFVIPDHVLPQGGQGSCTIKTSAWYAAGPVNKSVVFYKKSSSGMWGRLCGTHQLLTPPSHGVLQRTVVFKRDKKGTMTAATRTTPGSLDTAGTAKKTYTLKR